MRALGWPGRAPWGDRVREVGVLDAQYLRSQSQLGLSGLAFHLGQRPVALSGELPRAHFKTLSRQIVVIARRYEQQLCAWDHAIQETS